MTLRERPVMLGQPLDELFFIVKSARRQIFSRLGESRLHPASYIADIHPQDVPEPPVSV